MAYCLQKRLCHEKWELTSEAQSSLNNYSLKLNLMAQTSGGKKKVYVHPYTKEDGTKIPTHYRSTPNTSKGAETPKKK